MVIGVKFAQLIVLMTSQIQNLHLLGFVLLEKNNGSFSFGVNKQGRGSYTLAKRFIHPLNANDKKCKKQGGWA